MQYANEQCLNFNTFFTLPKPQQYFPDCIENTDTPFIPHIKERHRLAPAILESMTHNQPSFQFPNPYAQDIQRTTPYIIRSNYPMRAYDASSVKLIDSEDKLISAVEELKNEDLICIDVINHSFRSYQGFTCLVMISTSSSDYIFDSIALRKDLSLISTLLLDKNISKVFYKGKKMVECLQRDFSLYIMNGFDIGIATTKLGIERDTLEGLIEKYCQTIIPKKYTNADWRVRPLTKEMMYYSCSFTHYLPHIYSVMINQLKDLAINVACASNSVALHTYKRPSISDIIANTEKDYPSYTQLSEEKQGLMISLVKWRDYIARYEDESHQYVMPNTLMLAIVSTSPVTINELMYLCQSFVPPLVLYYAPYIIRLVMQSKIATPRQEPKPTPSLPQEVKAAEPAAQAPEVTPFKDKTNTVEQKTNIQTPACKCYEDILKAAKSSSTQRDSSESLKTPDGIIGLFNQLGWNNLEIPSSSKKAEEIHNKILVSPNSPSLFVSAKDSMIDPVDLSELISMPFKRTTEEDANRKIDSIVKKLVVDEEEEEEDDVSSPPEKLSMIYTLAGRTKKKMKSKLKVIECKCSDISQIVNAISETKVQKNCSLSNKENQYSFFKKLGWYHESAKKGYQY